jgi:hypothetical protein
LLVACLAASPLAAQTLANDYPTDAKADYVFGCMSANGPTQEMLRKCSCSIDVIASLLSYDNYVNAEAVLGGGLGGGRETQIFHTPAAAAMVANLRRAQAEAEVRCF